MILVTLLTLILVIGGNAYEISDKALISITGDGSYPIEVDGVTRVQVWLPKGNYVVRSKSLDLDVGDLRGVLVVFSNVSVIPLKASMYRALAGYDINVELRLVNVTSCSITKAVFWRGHYLEELTPFLLGSINISEDEGGCRLLLDTSRRPGYLYVNPSSWASITIMGYNYTISIVYGLKSLGVGGGGVTGQEGVTQGGRPHTTPIPLEVGRSSYGGINVNYVVIIGLLLILAFIVVVEYATGKRGY